MPMEAKSILIVEDEPIIAADLSMQLRKAGMNILDTLEDGQSAIDFVSHTLPDIIILDINLYGPLDGIDVSNQVNKHHSIPIIFLTSNTDSATFQRAKLTYPHAFLSKPFRINDVLHAIELALDQEKQKGEYETQYLADRVFIRHKHSLEKVLHSQILYIVADGAYSKIITRDKEYILSQTLKKTEEKITGKNLLKVHRSYIANIENVDRISEGYLYMGKHQIPVSRTQREDLLRLFKTI